MFCGVAARVLDGAKFLAFAIWLTVLTAFAAAAAPYAAMVIDARSGEVLHAENADTRLHPASLTKMMTLYIVFEAVEHGEITLDTLVTVSANAAAEPPSKLGLKRGQKIKLRYLIRAAAVKSANDAATALGEAISGSEAAFARRMNRTAAALGMTKTTFKNANGLTEEGHLSTARDMTTLGRHLFYDYPEYYNLFSRITADAGISQVSNTNRRFLGAYKGADGIKTGYTRAAGFNLVASAERGSERIIATVFGGRSTVTRNQRVAELLDLGFSRAKTRVAVVKPQKPVYVGQTETVKLASLPDGTLPAGTIKLTSTELKTSPRPRLRPGPEIAAPVIAAMEEGIAGAIAEVQAASVTEDVARQVASSAEVVPIPPSIKPQLRPEGLVLASATGADVASDVPAPMDEVVAEIATAPAPEIVTRVSSSGGRHWSINIGRYGSRYEAERVLLTTALREIGTLDEALRKVVKSPKGFEANFVGLSEDTAAVACARLQARDMSCSVMGPN